MTTEGGSPPKVRAGPFEGLPAPPMAAQTLVLALILRHSGASEFVEPGRSERHEAMATASPSLPCTPSASSSSASNCKVSLFH